MKILVADIDGVRATTVADELRDAIAGASVRILGAGESLAGAVLAFAPDVVLVDMARPDRDSLDSIRALHNEHPAPVVMFVDADDEQFMEAAIAAGVTSYHVRSTSPVEIKPVLRVAIAVFRRTHALSIRLAEAEDKLAQRQRIDAAKRLLMARDGMSEPAAHRFLQRRAMETQMKVADVAASLLGGEHG